MYTSSAKNINPFFFFKTGYVGAATVAGAAWWFMYDVTGPQVTYYQLVRKYSSFYLFVILKSQMPCNVSSSLCSPTSCSAMMRTRTLLAWNVRSLRLPLPWPWPCLCWSPLRCAMPSTGNTNSCSTTCIGGHCHQACLRFWAIVGLGNEVGFLDFFFK